MHRLLQTYLDELEIAASAKQLCQALTRISRGLDLPTFAYIAIPSTAGRQLRLITNYADPWRRHYVDQRYETCDPIVLQSIRQPHAFGWDSSFGSSDPFTRRFFDEACGFGIRHGYTIPIHHWHGRFAALTFATDEQYANFLRTTQYHALALRLIAYQFHRHVRQKLEPARILTGVRLTCRERQCLTLASEGRTFPDIALVLNISPRTVKGHVDSAKAKFGVRTAREAAALFLMRQHRPSEEALSLLSLEN
jgi:DNA-binding CsgD family transcriptional regulator